LTESVKVTEGDGKREEWALADKRGSKARDMANKVKEESVKESGE
jgi:hypothetical protein